MFVIIEYVGKNVIGLMLNIDGEVMTFETHEAARNYAVDNCAFEYKIAEI